MCALLRHCAHFALPQSHCDRLIPKSSPFNVFPTRMMNCEKCNMWTVVLQLVFIGVTVRIVTSCKIYGLVAACHGHKLQWVPLLPPNISHLYLERNRISEINSTSLQNLEQLFELDLGKQFVPLVIRNDAFLGQRHLVRLVLGDNLGLQLEPRAFAGMISLKQLFMDHCSLTDSILARNYLEPLSSLEELNLFGNVLRRLKPGLFFQNLSNLTQVNLMLNKIEQLCEEDLVGFRSKYFTHFNLDSNHLYKMATINFDWEKCGNPFRGMAFNILDLSTNGFSVTTTRLFLKAMQGTPVAHLIFSGYLGKGFSHDNLPDPDRHTFEGLANSTLNILDLSKNRIFALQRAVFSPLSNVIIIDVSQNKINQINDRAFSGMQGNLRLLNLSFNILGEIYSHTFSSLNELRVLDLSFNNIGALGDHTFEDLPKLRALYLTGNSLRILGNPASLPNLEFLLLGDNRLVDLYNIDKLSINPIHVDVTNNRLTNLEDVYLVLTNFNQLQNLFFGGNFIKWCTLGQNVSIPLNHSLQVLDLHDSSLQLIWAERTCLDVFNHLDNLLGLNLSFNSLTSLPQGIFHSLNSITVIDLSSNALTYLQPNVFPNSLRNLDLSNNFLATPEPMTFDSLLLLSLSGNRFHCDCHLESFLKWMNVTNVTFFTPVEDYRCEFPVVYFGLPLLNYSRIIEPCEVDDELVVRELKFALFIISTFLILTVTLSGIAYARLRGWIYINFKKVVGRVLEGPKAPPPLEDTQYDAYLCFSNMDYRWVEVALLKKLDNKFSEENILQCCFEARDFLPGEDHLSNIRDAIWGSKKTVCVVTKEFLKDGWCLEAFTLAQGRMLNELKNVLVMVLVGKVAHYQLMKYNAVRAFVQRREYLTWPEDPQDLEWFYERLVSQILKDTDVKKLGKDAPKPENDIQLENIQAQK
ncbi:toll-like receptor 5 isoform X2 [Syngnathoides biaculeatus]|uniref:toll-like receptor 5 isoform X2 n=1 Tax=Syngnathoides biaculeatus TaxID=300417 RepID=UPI0027A7E0EA|nr:toll-like receptor 5 isoform X2 [Syngnathoides biaculeatus]WHT06280.1 toll like receptor 5M [Syngnathoides biaculeatus]